MKRLIVYLKAYRKESVLAPLFKMFEAVLEIFVPLVVAAIIDNGIGNGDSTYIIRMCILMAGLGLAGLVSSVTAQYFAARAATGFGKKLRHALFDKIEGLDYTALDTLGVSTMVTRMTSDANQVQTGVNLTLRLLLRSPFVVFGAMAAAFTVDVKSAVIFAVVIPLLAMAVLAIMLVSIPLFRRVQSRLDAVLLAVRENLSGVRVLRAFAREKEETAEFSQKNGALTSLQKFAGRISALLNPVTYVMINLAIVLLIRGGAMHVYNGTLTTGELVALYNFMSQILVELIKFASLIITITKSLACARRISAVLDTESSENEASESFDDSIRGSVKFENVCLCYNGAAENTLTDISFEARPHETIGIIGGTGSGKSSLVSLIPGFYMPTSGRVTVDGADVTRADRKELIGRVAVVPQKALLFSGTIRENMLWGGDATDSEILKAIKTAQGADILEAKGGLDADVGQGGKSLSGGQRQRLTIARALVKNAGILILDDSSSALDFATDASLRRALQKLKNKPTVFIVSQRTSSIMHADRIIVLDDGHAVGIGTHNELLENCPIYREIYDSQFKKEGTAV